MIGEITLIEVAARPLAVVRVTTVLARWPREFRAALDQVYAAVGAGHVRQNGQNVMVYRPRADGLVDIECGIETVGPFEATGNVIYSATPTGLAVTGTHVGPYQRLGQSHRDLAEWTRAHGHRLSGIYWEIYGDWSDDPAKLRTEIFHLADTGLTSR